MHYPVIHSVLSPQALQKTLEKEYILPAIHRLDYYQAGLNDTYLINTKTQQYILRVYRQNWRSESDIRYEIDAINYLHKNDMHVATPIKNTSGEYLISVNAPEGLRYFVLFNYIKGKPPAYKKHHKQEVRMYGQSLGRMHFIMRSFNSNHSRFKLNINHLLNTPLSFIQPFLTHRKSTQDYLTQLSNTLIQQFNECPSSKLTTGFCHGDLNTQNVHIENNKLGIFDFDCCGEGYYAADLAAFRWGTRAYKNRDLLWKYFIDAYLTESTLSEVDIASIEFFSKMRHIWHIGLHIQLSKDRGLHWINDDYFDQQIDYLKEYNN